ncbi:hypothetical protein BDR03DRAFT_954726 [Suillus americanus]|nr:hypothetical protein BDR03DRAFT_954726 [Suillus americanus]
MYLSFIHSHSDPGCNTNAATLKHHTMSCQRPLLVAAEFLVVLPLLKFSLVTLLRAIIHRCIDNDTYPYLPHRVCITRYSVLSLSLHIS